MWFNIPLFSDVAVGAPGSGEGGQVFIYLGQSDGLTTQYVQVIESPFHTLIDPPMFGFSMRGGIDIDDNGYPGMLYITWKYLKSIHALFLLWNTKRGTIKNTMKCIQWKPPYTSM